MSTPDLPWRFEKTLLQGPPKFSAKNGRTVWRESIRITLVDLPIIWIRRCHSIQANEGQFDHFLGLIDRHSQSCVLRRISPALQISQVIAPLGNGREGTWMPAYQREGRLLIVWHGSILQRRVTSHMARLMPHRIPTIMALPPRHVL